MKDDGFIVSFFAVECWLEGYYTKQVSFSNISLWKRRWLVSEEVDRNVYTQAAKEL